MKIFYLFNNKIKGIKSNKINYFQILQKLGEIFHQILLSKKISR